MKIQEKLELLLQYYISTRKTGHTTLMKEGINHYNKSIFVLTQNISSGLDLNLSPNSVISYQNLDKLIGHNKPLIIDNGVMIELLSDALMKIEALEEENKKLNKQNKYILIKNQE